MLRNLHFNLSMLFGVAVRDASADCVSLIGGLDPSKALLPEAPPARY